MHVVLVAPQIPQNTGSIGRLCAGHDIPLHLVRPLGFELSDRYLKRAGLDYWPHIRLTIHDSLSDVFAMFPDATAWYLSARAEKTYWDTEFNQGDLLIFGCEAHGLPLEVKASAGDHLIGIPHNENIRSLNLAQAASVVMYEALRQQRTVRPAPGS
ncbi:MAG: tRNA (cytidine(34)-2'-O)-methyltransferase [Myxococcota bacterium]|nr:tRNA (cytidine(34)-2'-O)-methyltransferase [Myxococcota bacterium]